MVSVHARRDDHGLAYYCDLAVLLFCQNCEQLPKSAEDAGPPDPALHRLANGPTPTPS